MLSESKVLNYIKDNLNFPFQTLEWSDEKILEYLKEYTLIEFSKYIPDINKIRIDTSDTSILVPYTQNEFYISDPDGREILTVKNIYFSKSDLFLFNHPVMGPIGADHNYLRNWIVDTEVARMFKSFSDFNYTYKFIHPNIVRIAPIRIQQVLIEYERVHAEDFSSIPNEFLTIFKELSLSDIGIIIGRLRKRYSGNLRTPFGEIPISDEIFNEFTDKKREIIDKLETHYFTNITMDVY